MAYSTELFELIKSMSKAEKRYFKLYAAGLQSGEKQYLKVFDYIDKEEEYDEKVLLAYFKDEPFAKKFHVLKNYLFGLILRSMRAKESRSVNRKIQNQLADAHFLREKGLYKQEQKVLEKALKTATKYDFKIYQLEALSSLGRNTLEFTNTKLKESSSNISEQSIVIAKQLEQERQLDHIRNLIFVTSRKQRIIRKKEQIASLKKLIQPVLKLKDLENISFNEHFKCYSIMAIYHRLLQQPELCNSYFKKAVQLWERTPHMIESDQYNFKLTIFNYLSSCFNLADFSDFEASFKKIESLPCHSFNEEAEQFQNMVFYQLLYLANTGKSEGVLKLIPEIEEGLGKYKTKINKARELAITYSVTSFLFVSGYFETALDWCLKINLNGKVDPRRDIQQFARMLELIVHYELGNLQYLSNMLSSTYKALKKQDVLYEYERLILQYVKKIPFTPSKNEQLQLFKHFKADLNKFEQSNPKQKPLGIKELNIWLDSRMRNEPIRKHYLQSIQIKRQTNIDQLTL